MPKPNYKHLKHSKEQQKELLSLPYSKFIDKCLSQNDAHSFLKEHNLTPGKKLESKWRVRYSSNAKSKRLLQCYYGSDIQRTRKMNTFVSCLAFARITKLNNGVHIFGYLNHSEDCQRQNPSCVKNGVENYEHETKTNEERKVNEMINKNNDEYMAKNGEESKINKFKNNKLIRFENAFKWEESSNNEEYKLIRFENALKSWEESSNNEEYKLIRFENALKSWEESSNNEEYKLIRFENALKSWEESRNNEEFIPWDIFYQQHQLPYHHFRF
ncbi:unnamed protein product [Rhizophagus irregularis]|nr:unnamed protein product [Rhizophagus irregularis]